MRIPHLNIGHHVRWCRMWLVGDICFRLSFSQVLVGRAALLILWGSRFPACRRLSLRLIVVSIVVVGIVMIVVLTLIIVVVVLIVVVHRSVLIVSFGGALTSGGFTIKTWWKGFTTSSASGTDLIVVIG